MRGRKRKPRVEGGALQVLQPRETIRDPRPYVKLAPIILSRNFFLNLKDLRKTRAGPKKFLYSADSQEPEGGAMIAR